MAHWFCLHTGMISPDGKTMVVLLTRFGRLKAIHVTEDGVTRCLTSAQFKFWARGKGLTLNLEE